MDLLGKEAQKKQKSKGQKIVLMLLITSIFLLIIIISALFLLQSSGSKKVTLSMSVNDENIAIQENMLISDESGITYIMIENIAELVDYQYLKGGYLEYDENPNKGYIEIDNSQVIGFEANSNKIYKTDRDSSIDYEYYNLKHNIINDNDKLYIALEDLNIGCNLFYAYSEQSNTILINTRDYIIESYMNKIEEEKLELKISDESNNKKALLYDMIVASNKTGKTGVVDGELKPIIGYKYETIKFNEFGQNFIVSNEGQYGILSKQGNIIAELRYEDIEVINYSPLLYKVKINNKYGILDENGKIIINAEYDGIGFFDGTNSSTVIIEKVKNNENGIVVCKDNKYGIVNLKTGEVIVNCELDKIYSLDNNYYVELQNTQIELLEYIEYINTTTVITN